MTSHDHVINLEGTLRFLIGLFAGEPDGMAHAQRVADAMVGAHGNPDGLVDWEDFKGWCRESLPRSSLKEFVNKRKMKRKGRGLLKSIGGLF